MRQFTIPMTAIGHEETFTVWAGNDRFIRKAELRETQTGGRNHYIAVITSVAPDRRKNLVSAYRYTSGDLSGTKSMTPLNLT